MWKYCDSIFRLWFLILCLSFIHTFPFSFSFFLFFFLAFCPRHTYTHRIPSSLFFLYIPLDFKAFLSPYFSSSLILCSLFLFFFLFLFLLDSIYSLALSVILDSIILLAFWCHYLQSSNTHTRMERGEIVFAPPQHHRYSSSSSLRSACNQGSYRLLFFFFLIIYCCSNFFFSYSWSAVVVLILDLLFKLYQFYESKNFFCFYCCGLIIFKIMFLSLYFDYAWDGRRERSFVQRDSREMRWGAWGFRRERIGIFMGIFVIHHQPNSNSSNMHVRFDLWTSCGP